MRISEIAPRLCDRIAAGESLASICADGDMPRLPTVHRWLNKNPEFKLAYARAQRLQADRLADQIIEIADALDQKAGQEEARSARVRIDARKWVMSHLGGAVVSEEEIHMTPGRIVFCTPSDFAGQIPPELAPEPTESFQDPAPTVR